MPNITIIEFDGTKHEVPSEDGENLMEAAIRNSIPGIDGDCGGSSACGTCHVFVEDDWLKTLPEPDAAESGLLDTRPDRADSSRLACQIRLTDAMDGLTVKLPEMQM